MISMLLSIVGALLPSLVASAVAVLTGLWVLSRGYRGPGIALVLWAVIQACTSFAMLLLVFLGYRIPGGSALAIQAVAAIAHGLSSTLLVALLVYAALGDRISPSERRS